MDLSDVDSTDELSDEQKRELLFGPEEEEIEQQKNRIAEERGGSGTSVDLRGEGPRSMEHIDDDVVRAHHTLRLIIEHTNKNQRQAGRHVQALAERDAYQGRSVQKRFQSARGASDFYSTVVGEDGGILLPTEVRDEIQELADEVGAFRQAVRTFQNVRGTIKQPGATGVEDQANAVAEGGEITSSMRAFQSVALNPQKWAQIVPWSYEAQIELAPQILEDVQRALARSFSRAEDDAGLNGDGTSTYNGIDGVFSPNRSVPTYTINDSGQLQAGTYDSPQDVAPDDLVLARNQIDQGARNVNAFAYMFHPDLRNVFLTKKDDQGQYLFDYIEVDDGPDQLKGADVYYTDVLPQADSTTGSENFGALVNGNYILMALGEGMTSEEMTQGTVKDADDGSDINLGTQDLRALKARMFFDLGWNFDQAMVKFQTQA